jgi:hypothetical protein
MKNCFCISILFLLFASFLNAQTIVNGDTVILGGGIAYTWVEVDNNNPLRVGITLTIDAITNPAPGTKSIDFPGVAVNSIFKHAYFDYAPSGHPPLGIYGTPHFDFHFYMITRSERILIPGGMDRVEIPEVFMPEDYIAVPDLGTTSFAQMGVHYVDSLAEELNGGTFKNTLIYGFYEAEMIFIEPMITIQHLLLHQNEELLIKQPAEYQKTGYYPTSYGVNFDSINNLYKIYLTDFEFKNGTTSINEINPLVPEKFNLYQNYPNPFNPATKVSWQSSVSGHQTLKVYDLLGREVATLVDEYKPSGSYEVEFDASKLSSGTYFYRLTAGDPSAGSGQSFVETKKLILMK